MFLGNVESAKILIYVLNYFHAFNLLVDEKIAKLFVLKMFKFAEKFNSEQFYYLWNQIPATFFIRFIIKGFHLRLNDFF